jgi:DNA-binding response OmpR family regulator
MTDPAVRILVVEDERELREAVGEYLVRLGYSVETTGDGVSALSSFDRHQPALVLLDLMLPMLSGEEVCRSIRARSRVPVVMMTAKAAEEDMLSGLDLGADDYLVKPFSLKVLAARVAAVLRRSAPDTAVAERLFFDEGRLVVDPERHEARKDGRTIPLTRIEMAILFTLSSHPTKVFTREELIAQAMGDDFEGFDRTVDSHIKNLRLKIEDEPRVPRYIATVHGVGYRFEGGRR